MRSFMTEETGEHIAWIYDQKRVQNIKHETWWEQITWETYTYLWKGSLAMKAYGGTDV
jgi:hypothetical protein